MMSPEDERAMTRRVLRKLDSHILPPLALLWLANFIDRSNIGNAKIAGLAEDTHLVGNQYNIILAVFYVTYIMVELPSNWILKIVGANRWIPLLVISWGFVTIMTCFVKNFGGLIAIRMLLGFTEGGLLPGIVLYLSTMYKRHELQLRVGIFYASASLSGAFGGLLASAILKMDGVGGLEGWKWIFVLEGIATMILGGVAAVFMPRNLETAPFFTDEERAFALHRFHSADSIAVQAPASTNDSPSFAEKGKQGETQIEKLVDQTITRTVSTEEEKFELREAVRGATDVQTWLTGLAYFGMLVSLYSYSLFLPTIVAGMGYSGTSAQLRTVPPYVPAAVMTVVVAVFSDRLKWRGPFVLMCLPVSIAGYILAIAAPNNEARYAAVFLIATGVYSSVPCILSILPNNHSGHFKKATSTALQLAIANASGFVATFSYTTDQAPRFIRGHSICLGFLCLAWLMIGLNVLYCKWENSARAAGKRDSNLEKYQLLWDAGETRAPIGDRHPDFRYTL